MTRQLQARNVSLLMPSSTRAAAVVPAIASAIAAINTQSGNAPVPAALPSEPKCLAEILAG